MSFWTIFCLFFRLGCSSFGGPIAHLGFFREALVVQRRWLDDSAYAELVALCQLLPGPASSQLGMALGFGQAGYRGAVAAWLGFTLPSALLLAVLATVLTTPDAAAWVQPWLAGLKIVAVAVVAQALWGMSRTLITQPQQYVLALVGALSCLQWPGVVSQLVVIAVAAVLPLVWAKTHTAGLLATATLQVNTRQTQRSSRRTSTMLLLVLFFLLLLGLPWFADLHPQLNLFDSFYRAGALVFGGGHVVLPLLEAELVGRGLISADDFVTAYGAAQAVPGPLFTIASYLGVTAAIGGSPWFNALLATVAIFLPGFLLVIAILPWWQQLRQWTRLRLAINGINAAVVGILLAAWLNPVLTSAITGWQTAVAALIASWLLLGLRIAIWQLLLLALTLSPWL